MHALVDTYSGLPLSYIITPANIADMDVAEALIQKMMDDYENGLTPKYYMMDAGYDKPDLYSSIYHKFHGQAIIPLNWRNTKIPPEGINMKGQLVCPMNYAYVYGGNDNGTIRLLCPHACGKCDCPMGSAWCTSAQSGYVGKVKKCLGQKFLWIYPVLPLSHQDYLMQPTRINPKQHRLQKQKKPEVFIVQ